MSFLESVSVTPTSTVVLSIPIKKKISNILPIKKPFIKEKKTSVKKFLLPEKKPLKKLANNLFVKKKSIQSSIVPKEKPLKKDKIQPKEKKIISISGLEKKIDGAFLLPVKKPLTYKKIIAKEVGRRYNIKLIVNFPGVGKIDEFEMYGKRDLSLIIDHDLRKFSIDREMIKQKAKEILGDVETQDAYMNDDKEGVRIHTKNWKIDILPHSLHIWIT